MTDGITICRYKLCHCWLLVTLLLGFTSAINSSSQVAPLMNLKPDVTIQNNFDQAPLLITRQTTDQCPKKKF